MGVDREIYSPFDENFKVDILEEANNIEIAMNLEHKYIKSFNTIGEQGYNKLKGHPPSQNK